MMWSRTTSHDVNLRFVIKVRSGCAITVFYQKTIYQAKQLLESEAGYLFSATACLTTRNCVKQRRKQTVKAGHEIIMRDN